jgi:hypothetical protein
LTLSAEDSDEEVSVKQVRSTRGKGKNAPAKSDSDRLKLLTTFTNVFSGKRNR